MCKLLEPIEIEVEKYTEEDYDRMLNEIYGEIKIGYLTFSSSDILKEWDYIVYKCGFQDFQEYETQYKCPICKDIYGDESKAKYCCQEDIEE